MRGLLSLFVSGFFIVSCSGRAYHSSSLEEMEAEVPAASVVDEVPPVLEKNNEVFLGLSDSQLQSAYNSFLSQGVPSVALKRAFQFFSANRASFGGLKDTSCLIQPMSESGEIDPNSNRFDPTTKAMLKQGVRNERYIMIVDFTQPNTSQRGYLLDLKPDASGQYKIKRMTIAHGYGSKAIGGVPQVFTNASGYGTTVSGFFVTGSVTYPYVGHISSGSYSSTGLRLYGLESTNNTAEKTSKVSHGAPYVSNQQAGNSAGCAAMTFENAKTLLPQLTGGILWYHHTKATNNVNYQTPSCAKATLSKVFSSEGL